MIVDLKGIFLGRVLPLYFMQTTKFKWNGHINSIGFWSFTRCWICIGQKKQTFQWKLVNSRTKMKGKKLNLIINLSSPGDCLSIFFSTFTPYFPFNYFSLVWNQTDHAENKSIKKKIWTKKCSSFRPSTQMMENLFGYKTQFAYENHRIW